MYKSPKYPSKESILAKIEIQNPELISQIQKAEWGMKRVGGKEFTAAELDLLVDRKEDIVNWLRTKGIHPRIYQIMVMRQPGRVVMRAGRRLGKNFTASALIAYELDTNPNAKILVASATKNHSNLLRDEVTKLGINPNKISWLPPNHMGHGFSPDLMVLDEPDYMKDDLLDVALVMAPMAKKLVSFITPGKGKIGMNLEAHADKVYHFPSYCNPHWGSEEEEFFKKEYKHYSYKSEIEAIYE